MRLRLQNCDAADLQNNLSRHTDVADYLDAALCRKTAYAPSCLSVRWKTDAFILMEDGQITKEAAKAMKHLKRLPMAERDVLGQNVVIHADISRYSVAIGLQQMAPMHARDILANREEATYG